MSEGGFSEVAASRAMWAAPQISPASSRSRTNSSGAGSTLPSAEATQRCDTRTDSRASTNQPSNTFTPAEPSVDPALVLPTEPVIEEPPARPGALTRSVMQMLSTAGQLAQRRLHQTPLRPSASSSNAGEAGASGVSASALAAADLTAELHVDLPPVVHAVPFALSKESLDVLRAERIARRMASEAAVTASEAAVTVAEASPRVAICTVVDDDGSTTKRGKLKSSRKDRVYLSIASTPNAQSPAARRQRSEVLRASACEEAPRELEVLVELDGVGA